MTIAKSLVSVLVISFLHETRYATQLDRTEAIMDSEVCSPEHNRIEGQPYRSHMHPACINGRARKSRCRTTSASPSCLMCHTNDTECVFPCAAERSRRRLGHTRMSSHGKHTTASSRSETARAQRLSSDSLASSQRIGQLPLLFLQSHTGASLPLRLSKLVFRIWYRAHTSWHRSSIINSVTISETLKTA